MLISFFNCIIDQILIGSKQWITAAKRKNASAVLESGEEERASQPGPGYIVSTSGPLHLNPDTVF